MLPTSLASFLVPLLNFLTVPLAPSPPLQFQLRHVHAVSSSARVVFADVPSNTDTKSLLSYGGNSYDLTTRRVKSFRPPTFDAFSQARVRSMKFGQSQSLAWKEDQVLAPDVEDRETLLALAKMANNAYVVPDEGSWYDLGVNWTVSYPFGWEPDDDGFRGHVFATPDNETVVLSIKGTSAGVFGGGGPTVKKDKLNDNLLFSCCCARIDWTWTTVCGCYRGGWKCDQDCVEEALIEESLFYPVGTNLYNNLSYMYPDSNIWIIGHSLGGALASLVGVTFGAPVIAFESPGEKMAASRLHLPSPPSTQHITHVYHTADPIAMGTCNGILSSCALGGYAMESRCHLGESIVYDTVSNLSWTVDVRTHGIVTVIEKVLTDPWPPSVDMGRQVPEAAPEEDCVECYSWEYGNFD
ncbi:alpha/beta-hydrolase [Guyanagaster necrorhizus]|uniref:triacylglycerol lipase n=1 Tax=Guyanagaster necrorhizus TaxID=856835 RepID=A0A9P7W4V4_9AGAR|nr:alpha/beta-hydrolase [Guyanagaster necrorhizus MCA 3950]KAG7451346.1 alpha/beta-hydrolase [Guyanagaster necrorhizus MCA 3950]